LLQVVSVNQEEHVKQYPKKRQGHAHITQAIYRKSMGVTTANTERVAVSGGQYRNWSRA